MKTKVKNINKIFGEPKLPKAFRQQMYGGSDDNIQFQRDLAKIRSKPSKI